MSEEESKQTRIWRERAEAAEESEQRVRKDCLFALKENEFLRTLQRQVELSQATLLETQSQLGHALAHENEYKAKHLHLTRDMRELCHEIRIIVSDVLPPNSLDSLLPQDFDPDSLQPYHVKTLIHMLRDAYLKAELRVRNRDAELSEVGENTEEMEAVLCRWSHLLSQISDPPNIHGIHQLTKDFKVKDKLTNSCLREMHVSLSTFLSAMDHGYRIMESELSHLRERVSVCIGEDSVDSAQLGLILTGHYTNKKRQIQELESKIKELKQSRVSEMTGAISALKLEMVEQRSESDRLKEIDMQRELSQKLEEYKSESLCSRRQEEIGHSRKVKELSESVSVAERGSAELRRELESVRIKMKSSEFERNRLSTELEHLQENQRRNEVDGCEERGRAERICGEELDVYRQQVRQHSLTIVSLEDKLVRTVRECDDLRDNLRDSNIRVDEERDSIHREEIESIKRERDRKEGEIMTLRSELLQEKSTGDKLCSEIAILRSTNTQLKRKLITEVEHFHLSENKLEKTRGLVSKLERSLEQRIMRGHSQREELVTLRENMPHVRETVDGIHQNLTTLSHDFTDYKSIQELDNPLTMTGIKCTEEQHQVTISKQAQAITELRSSLEQMREANVLVPTHQESLREVTRLRKGLRDAKAALSGNDLVYALMNGDIVEEELQKQLRTRDAAHLQEKLLHENTTKCLEISEEAFRQIITAVKGSMKIQIPLECSNSLEKLTDTELELEQVSRTRQIEAVRIQLKIMYENMKQSQTLVTEYQKDQIDDLRMSLDGVKDELHSQRELNLSLQAQRDYFKTENLVVKKHPSHKCGHTKESIDNMLAVERRKHKDKMRRKDQEIVALRATLTRLND
ncbi:hypothetical protein LOD99_5089 [Oopsacas minuta]|uniref:Uncharacterized protein n=1 Tax=Oopsacas minuta TaxID=111878 RepID=A0AAV7JS15_9METZ|nr:hypothetical protein LOD99_5089 [Oopsacas minuta]